MRFLQSFLVDNTELSLFADSILSQASSLNQTLGSEKLVLDLLQGHLSTLLAIVGPSIRSGEKPSLLSQLIDRSLNNWAESNREIFLKFKADRSDLAIGFGIDGELTSISAGTGDFHRGGRSVRILTFASGPPLVFKPRSMQIDRSFQDFLQWINTEGFQQPFRQLKIVERQDYGWSEFVEFRPCASQALASAFDFRLGGLLAIFYVLGATDMHMQNILASCEQPVAIDLETLFHRFPRHTEADIKSASAAAYRDILSSVNSVGILPWPMQVGPEMWLDMGALGGRFYPPGLQTRVSALNRPMISGEAAPVDLHSFIAGFKDAYKILCARRSELLSDSGPLAAFRGNLVRVVIQGTYSYQQNLLRSYEPEFLRDENTRACYFDSCFAGSPPGLKQFAGSEKTQLQAGDIPFFEIATDGEELVGADGSRFKNVAGQNGWSTVQQRVESLSLNEMERQLWFIRAAYGAGNSEASVLPSRGVSVEAAAILREKAIHYRDCVSWISSMRLSRFDDEALFQTTPMPAGLKNGLVGVALFLGLTDGKLCGCVLKTLDEEERGTNEELAEEIFLRARIGELAQGLDRLQESLASSESASTAVLFALKEAAKSDATVLSLTRSYAKRSLSLPFLAARAELGDLKDAAVVPINRATNAQALAVLLIASRLKSPSWERAAQEILEGLDYRCDDWSFATGTAGTIAVYKTASEFLQDSRWRERFYETRAQLPQLFAQAVRSERLGLADGLAGVGYAALIADNLASADVLLML